MNKTVSDIKDVESNTSNINSKATVSNKHRQIYCHFSFKRPKGKEYGLFAVAFYRDFEGKDLITYKVRRMPLWDNQQFVTAIQSYENALRTISEMQGYMMNGDIYSVMLVTDNSTLAGWIENPSKNKAYFRHMMRANKHYKIGGAREIVINVGLCEPRHSEKSYKYCKEELAIDEMPHSTKVNKIKVDTNSLKYSSVLDIIKADESIPMIDGGIKEIEAQSEIEVV